jgi:uncharacterized protein
MSAATVLDEFLKLLTSGVEPEQIASLFTDPVELYAPGSPELPWAGRRSTRSEVVEFFRLLGENETMEDFRIDKTYADDDTAAAVGEFTCKFHRSGQRLNTLFCLQISVVDDKITRYVFLENSLAAVAAFTGADMVPGEVV